VTGARHRVAAFLVESPAPRVAVSLPAACRAAVLGAVADVVPLAAALALTLRAADRRPAVLVALWGAAPPRAAPAARAAAKLAAAVTPFAAASEGSSPADGGIARGRLAWLGLPAEPAAAVDAVIGAAAVVDTPLVTALAGARPAALDSLVAGHDLVVAAAAPGTPLAQTATARLAERGVPAVACRPPSRGLARTLAVAGWVSPRLDLAGAHEVER
jgi:hypothetical protein